MSHLKNYRETTFGLDIRHINRKRARMEAIAAGVANPRIKLESSPPVIANRKERR